MIFDKLGCDCCEGCCLLFLFSLLIYCFLLGCVCLWWVLLVCVCGGIWFRCGFLYLGIVVRGRGCRCWDGIGYSVVIFVLGCCFLGCWLLCILVVCWYLCWRLLFWLWCWWCWFGNVFGWCRLVFGCWVCWIVSGLVILLSLLGVGNGVWIVLLVVWGSYVW